MALWLAAAIVAIVVLMTPGPSQAHEGHGGAQAPSHALVVEGVPGDVRASLRSLVQDAAPEPASGEIRSPERDCADPCCGGSVQTSSCCCAIGLAPVPDAVAPRVGPEARPLARDARNRPSISLGALPEPPRPLA